MAFVEDFTPFLDRSEFAEEALFSAAGSGLFTAVTVVFDLEYAETLEGMVGGAGPAAHCSVQDVPGAKRGDSLTVRGVVYQVVEPMPDGTGWQTLRLREA